MIDRIINTLKDKVGGDLVNKIGLDPAKADGAIKAAGSSVQEVIGGKGVDLSSVLNLFSKDANSGGANALLGSLGQNYLGKLTGQVGLDATKAAGVKDLVIPVLTKLLSDKVGGDKSALTGLLGGKAGDLLGGAGGKLGGLGKLFGK